MHMAFVFIDPTAGVPFEILMPLMPPIVRAAIFEYALSDEMDDGKLKGEVWGGGGLKKSRTLQLGKVYLKLRTCN